MNNKNIVMIVLIVMFFATWMVAIIFDKPVTDEKFERCLARVNQVSPDPNDTEERSLVMKQCYEN